MEMQDVIFPKEICMIYVFQIINIKAYCANIIIQTFLPYGEQTGFNTQCII